MFIPKLIVACLLVGLVASSALGSDIEEIYTVFGVGHSSCGNYIELKRDSVSEWERSAQRSWLGGYITAFNFLTPGTKNILNGTDLNGAMGWIENWCRTNPLKSFSDAARMLVLELQPTKRSDSLNLDNFIKKKSPRKY